MPSSCLKGQVAVVTGASAGIGLAIAKRFAAEGAYVFVTGRRPDILDAAVGEIAGNVTGVPGDAASLADLDLLYKSVAEQGRRIDVRRSSCPARRAASWLAWNWSWTAG